MNLYRNQNNNEQRNQLSMQNDIDHDLGAMHSESNNLITKSLSEDYSSQRTTRNDLSPKFKDDNELELEYFDENFEKINKMDDSKIIRHKGSIDLYDSNLKRKDNKYHFESIGTALFFIMKSSYIIISPV